LGDCGLELVNPFLSIAEEDPSRLPPGAVNLNAQRFEGTANGRFLSPSDTSHPSKRKNCEVAISMVGASFFLQRVIKSSKKLLHGNFRATQPMQDAVGGWPFGFDRFWFGGADDQHPPGLDFGCSEWGFTLR
jgi:hypothetical protein